MNGTARDMRQWAAGILCALALLLSGIQHHPATRIIPADLADYVLPDGSIPDLCLSEDHAGDEPAGHDHGGGHACGPCCLSPVVALPLPAVAYLRSRVSRPAGAVRPVYVSVLPPAIRPGLGARAPPSAGYTA